MTIKKKAIAAADIAALLQAEIKGHANTVIDSVAELSDADKNNIVFFSNERYFNQLTNCSAGIIITQQKYVASCPSNTCVLVVANPQRAWATLLNHLYARPKLQATIHPTAIIPSSCQIDSSVCIGAYCVLGERVVIGADTVVSAGCTLGDDVKLGQNCYFHPRVTLYSDVDCGDCVQLHAGAVIGADGFGNIKDEKNHWKKLPQIGSVSIGHHVEIGANTTIDCGALKNSIIEDGVRIDNMVYLAHNVTVGAHTAIAAGTIVAGTVIIGKHCLIGGGCSIAGHLNIADHVIITATSSVSKSIKQTGVYSSGQPVQPRQNWHKSVVHYRNLDSIVKRVKNLERKINE